MSSAETKKNMARAGTMQVTSKEGMSYLKKNLPNHWKYINQLKVHFEEENETKGTSSSAGKKRGSGAMAGAVAGGSSAGSSPGSKNQPPAKKPRLAKTRTMAATAEEGALLLGNQILGDTRQMTKQSAKNAKKKQKQMKRSKVEKAKAIKTKVKKHLVTKKSKKSSLKKANTMVKTAKEGKAFITKNGAELPQKRRGQTS